MIIKVCGMRDPENIAQVQNLGIDLMGFIFYPKSPRYVQQIPTNAGIIPDKPSLNSSVLNPETESQKKVQTVGVFVNDMPQNIVTRVYNYKLDYVQLHGDESAIMIDNLKSTLIPDIAPNIKIIKALSIHTKEDLERWKKYEGHVDLLLFDTKCKCVGGSGEQFDWSILEHYDGNTPFLLSGGIGPDDAEKVLNFKHPKCVGIDINSRFEVEPALKDVAKLRHFIEAIRQ